MDYSRLTKRYDHTHQCGQLQSTIYRNHFASDTFLITFNFPKQFIKTQFSQTYSNSFLKHNIFIFHELSCFCSLPLEQKKPFSVFSLIYQIVHSFQNLQHRYHKTTNFLKNKNRKCQNIELNTQTYT